MRAPPNFKGSSPPARGAPEERPSVVFLILHIVAFFSLAAFGPPATFCAAMAAALAPCLCTVAKRRLAVSFVLQPAQSQGHFAIKDMRVSVLLCVCACAGDCASAHACACICGCCRHQCPRPVGGASEPPPRNTMAACRNQTATPGPFTGHWLAKGVGVAPTSHAARHATYAACCRETDVARLPAAGPMVAGRVQADHSMHVVQALLWPDDAIEPWCGAMLLRHAFVQSIRHVRLDVCAPEAVAATLNVKAGGPCSRVRPACA